MLVTHKVAPPFGFCEDLLVKRSPFTPEEVRRVREFASGSGFLVSVAPGEEGNSLVSQFVNAPEVALRQRLHDADLTLGPVTDDQPFFFHVLRWRDVFSGLVAARKDVWYFPGSVIGQLMLLIMLVQSLLLGSALILLPLGRRGLGRLPWTTTLAFMAYFLGLGLGFLMIEISFVQKYVLVLGYPTYSLSVTVCSLLVSAAIGAAISRRGWGHPQRFLCGLLAATVGLIVLERAVVPVLQEHLLAASLPVCIAMTVVMQFPLGLALGMYFPTGLELLRRREPRLIPWAWAVNGVASVVATVLAVMLAMEIGFSNVSLVAAGAYLIGTLTLLVSLRGGSAEAQATP
jgi:hypothetical protein